MGVKGDKGTNEGTLTAELLIEKLVAIPEVNLKKMFGGYGIFCDGKMFGLVNSKGQAYFKANDSNMDHFENHGSHRHSKMPYFSVPDEVIMDQDTLVEWAKSSIALTK